jgi:hypothetical protein
MGNSFTHGNSASVTPYNNANVHDFNGTTMGGVPGIFQKLAADGGRSNLAVNIEAVSGQTLAYHLANKSGVITNPGAYGPWDWVVLQDYSTRPTKIPGAGDVDGFRSNVQSLSSLATNNSPAVRTLLYCTWGRPDIVAAGDYPSIQSMQTDLTTNYSDAARDFNLFGFAPVGDAFMAAVASGLSINPNVTPTLGPGQIDLWQSDNYHASVYGSYLAALVFYTKILGADPRSLPTGPGSAASDLGLNPSVVVQLRNIAYETVSLYDFSFAIDRNVQTVTVGSNTSFIVTVGATNGFTGDVVLSATGLPANVTADFNPVSLTNSGTSTLSLTISTNAPPGSYSVAVTGTSSNTTHTVVVTLTINTPDFSLAVAPDACTVTAGSNTAHTVNVGATNGFTGEILLSITGLPTDVTADFSPASLTNSGTSTLSITTSNASPPGSFILTIAGTSTGIIHTSTVALTINAPELIPSWWLQKYFGCTICPQADPAADPDGDGMNNLAEFLAGTDPTNSASGFRIITAIPQDSDILVIWQGCGGKTNAVQATPNLVDSYADVSSNIILSGSGEQATNFLDVGAATNASRFYRLRLVP